MYITLETDYAIRIVSELCKEKTYLPKPVFRCGLL